MDENTILKILSGPGKELEEIRNNMAAFMAFLNLINTIDALPEINQSASRENLSLYQTVSMGLSMEELKKYLGAFFGAPVKPDGRKSPFRLKFNSSARFLGGIQIKQALFTRRLKHGEFYGSLWPWQRKDENITIHLGFSSTSMTDGDYAKLELAVRKSLARRVLEKIDNNIGGRIHGVSLPSFLQMAEMEKTTGTLTIQTQANTGHLYLLDGRLLDASTDEFQGPNAAYTIISWDRPLIEIDPVCPRTKPRITLPLMSILMEGMRLKDENRLPGEGPGDSDIEISTRKIQTISTAHSDIEISTQQVQKIRSAARQKTRPRPDRNQTGVDRPPEPETERPRAAADTGPSPAPVAKKKKRLTVSMGILILIILVAAGLSAWEFGIRPLQIKKEYMTTLADIDNQPTLEEKAILLQFYINTHLKGPYTPEAEQKLKAVYRLMEDRDFDNMLMDTQHLASSEYVADATAIYLQFLEKYPDTSHFEEIRHMIKGLPGIVEKREYQALGRLDQHTPEERLTAYRDFLLRHPDGAHTMAVQKRIADIHDEKFHALENQVALNRQQKNWAAAILLCKNFLAAVNDHPRQEQVEKIRRDLEHERDRADLEKRLARTDADPAALRLACQDFLARHPDTPELPEIQKKIRALEKQIFEEQKWQEMQAYCQDSRIDIVTRLSHLKKHIRDNRSSAHMDAAQSLLARLETNRQEQARKIMSDQRKKIMTQRQWEKQNLERQAFQVLEKQVITALDKSGGRFKSGSDGTVTDTDTGLMWCMTDSHLVLGGRCMTFDAALGYVSRLSTGDYHDWRLPTPGELAGLYKSRPYYPASGAKWYWTSEFSTRSWNIGNTIIIFYPDIKDTYKKQSVDPNQCGAVHAVRP